jgi:hypothetical protein
VCIKILMQEDVTVSLLTKNYVKSAIVHVKFVKSWQRRCAWIILVLLLYSMELIEVFFVNSAIQDLVGLNAIFP